MPKRDNDDDSTKRGRWRTAPSGGDYTANGATGASNTARRDEKPTTEEETQREEK